MILNEGEASVSRDGVRSPLAQQEVDDFLRRRSPASAPLEVVSTLVRGDGRFLLGSRCANLEELPCVSRNPAMAGRQALAAQQAAIAPVPHGPRRHARLTGQYLVMAHPVGIELHFWHKPDVDGRTNDVACYVRFESDSQAQALHDSWSRNVRGGRLHAPTTTDYGLLEFALVDLDGNLLRVGGRVPSRRG